MTTRRSIALGLTGLLAGAVLAGGVAYATIPDSSGVIYGCYTNKSPHVVRVIDTEKVSKCPTGTTALNWNQAGVPGPKGDPGTELNKVTKVVGAGTSVPSYRAVNPDPGFTVVASATITATGTGPQLIQLTWTEPTITPGVYLTPCGRVSAGEGGTFYLRRSDGTVASSSNVWSDLVPGPGTYTYQVTWTPFGCTDPVSGQGIATVTVGAFGISLIQM